MNMKLLTTSLLAFGCGLAMTIVSCNGDKDGIADAPNQPTRGQDAVHVLTNNCNSTIGADRCASGAATTSYDQLTGILSVSNSNDLASGVRSTFAAAHDGQVDVTTQIPQSATQQFSTVAYDANIEQGRVDLGQDPNDASRSTLTPAFKAGNGTYRVE